MVDWTTAAVTASATGIVQFAFWFLFRRSVERLEAENGTLSTEVRNLEEKRVAVIERELKEDSEKRGKIYRDMEQIRLEWMSKTEGREIRAAIAAQTENYIAAVLKLERVSTEVVRLVSWVDDISKEQISLGKDLSAIGDRVKNIKSVRIESPDE